MSTDLTVSFIYTHKAHGGLSEDGDTAFYAMLPDVRKEYLQAPSSSVPNDLFTTRNTYTPPRQARRGYGETVQVIGTAILTSSALAAIIKAYLEHKKTTVTIKMGSTQVQFSGPSLKKSAKEIETVIDKLSQKAPSGDIMLVARRRSSKSRK